MCKKCRNAVWPPLSNRRVVIGTTASISIYRIPDLARELGRKGADVHIGMSPSSAGLVSPEVMRWASSNDPVTEISGEIEHIKLFEDGNDGTVLVLAPASYNLIGKIANGISDTVPALFFAFAFGHGIPVVVAPAMHRGMLENRINEENIDRLKKLGIDFADPEMDPEKAKLSDQDTIIDHIIRADYSSTLSGKSVLVISGRTEEHIDPVRVVTNRSTGTAGYWIARNAFRLGAKETVFIGNASRDLPSTVESHIIYETDSLYRKTEEMLRNREFDVVIVPAAISDFTLKPLREKADSSKELSLSLKPREKLLNVIRRYHAGALVAFRLSSDASDIRKHFSGSGPDMIVYNRIEEDSPPFGETAINYSVYNGAEAEPVAGASKEEATFRLLIHISGLKKKPDKRR